LPCQPFSVVFYTGTLTNYPALLNAHLKPLYKSGAALTAKSAIIAASPIFSAS